MTTESKPKTYFIKKPDNKGRASFDIIERCSGKNKSLSSDPRIQIINNLYRTKKITIEKATQQINEIKKALQDFELKRRGVVDFNNDNIEVIEKYLEVKYPPSKRKRLDFDSVKNEVSRVFSVIEPHSLLSVTQDQLQSKIDELDSSQQRRYVYRINSILKVLGRIDINLAYDRKIKQRIEHINIQDLMNLKAHVPYEYFLLYATCYATGSRIGEALALDSSCIKDKYVMIKVQLKQSGKLGETKNRKIRKALIIPDLFDYVKEFVELDQKPDRYKATKILRKITSDLFKKDKNKQISLHGLRHSYAVHLIKFGLNISAVAMYLGDGIQVTQDHYVDFIVDDSEIDKHLAMLKRV